MGNTETIRELLEETLSGLGATNKTYTTLLEALRSQNTLRISRRLLPGQLVFFKYNPQNAGFLKKSNPYDIFPLVIVTRVTKYGFEGINLHYHNKTWRNVLFTVIKEKLPIISKDSSWARLGSRYEAMKKKSIYRLMNPCWRRYLLSGLTRMPVIIPQENWNDLLELDAGLFANGKKININLQSYKKSMKPLL